MNGPAARTLPWRETAAVPLPPCIVAAPLPVVEGDGRGLLAVVRGEGGGEGVGRRRRGVVEMNMKNDKVALVLDALPATEKLNKLSKKSPDLYYSCAPKLLHKVKDSSFESR